MADKQSVVIHDYRHDAHTGRIEVHLKVKHESGNAEWHGPIRQYGCDAQTLRDRFNGNIEEFEAWAAKQHRSIEGIHPDMVQKLMERKGKVIR